MKKKKFLFIPILAMLLTSCEDTHVIDMENVTWKLDMFGLTTTSEQMKKQYGEIYQEGDDSYFSNITINNTLYLCTIYMVNSLFDVKLYDRETFNYICFFGDDIEFLYGGYDNPKKHQGEEFDYTIEIQLLNSGAYYEYCLANSIEFEKTLVLYGYQQ